MQNTKTGCLQFQFPVWALGAPQVNVLQRASAHHISVPDHPDRNPVLRSPPAEHSVDHRLCCAAGGGTILDDDGLHPRRLHGSTFLWKHVQVIRVKHPSDLTDSSFCDYKTYLIRTFVFLGNAASCEKIARFLTN